MLLFLVCSSRKYPYPLPPEGNGNSEGRGIQKQAISEGAGRLLTEFFPGDLSKIGGSLINDGLSV